MTHQIPTGKTFTGAALVAAAVIAGGTATALQGEATDPPSPAAGHSEVVATWLVNFEDGPYEWNVAEHQVDSVGIDLTHAAPTFLIGDGEYSTVITGPEVRGRLADGEALFRRPTLTTHAAALGGEPATLMEWTISTDDTGPGSDPFEPGPGAHDIDIIRDWLAPSETFNMKAGIPAFVMVSSGWVTTADGTRIDAGGWATLQGDIALTNGGEEPAVLLAAWISPVLELPAAPTTTEHAEHDDRADLEHPACHRRPDHGRTGDHGCTGCVDHDDISEHHDRSDDDHVGEHHDDVAEHHRRRVDDHVAVDHHDGAVVGIIASTAIRSGVDVSRSRGRSARRSEWRGPADHGTTDSAVHGVAVLTSTVRRVRCSEHSPGERKQAGAESGGRRLGALRTQPAEPRRTMTSLGRRRSSATSPVRRKPVRRVLRRRRQLDK